MAVERRCVYYSAHNFSVLVPCVNVDKTGAGGRALHYMNVCIVIFFLKMNDILFWFTLHIILSMYPFLWILHCAVLMNCEVLSVFFLTRNQTKCCIYHPGKTSVTMLVRLVRKLDKIWPLWICNIFLPDMTSVNVFSHFFSSL